MARPDGGKERVRILVLEDSQADADLIGRRLSRELDNLDIRHVATRGDFLDALRGGDLDLILSDYALPAFDGLSALELVVELAPDTPFIFVSGASGEEFAAEAMKKGATDYVLKRRLARLPAAVMRALAESRKRSDLRRAEGLLSESVEAVRRNEEWLRLALEAGELGSWEIDRESGEARHSARYHSIMGVDPGRPSTALDFRERILPEDLEQVLDVRRQVEAGADAWRFECRILRPDGAMRWIEVRGRTISDDAGRRNRLIGIIADITERKAAALALEAAVRERTAELALANAALRAQIAEREKVEATLRQMQRLEAVGQLTSGVAHDFNNLLTVILGNIDFLSRGVTNPRQVARLIHVRQAAERGAKLTSQLLAFSRRQRLEPKALDLNQTVTGMGDLLRSTMGGSVGLETQLKPNLWPALVDATQIELAILNLAINARDAMPAGGTLSIETANIALRRPPRRPEEPQPGDYVMVSVTDTGSGMAPEVLAKAFEPFFTTKEVGEGSGLGLSQVLGFAQQSGGGVRIETREGHGSAIRIYLPRARAEAGAPAADGQLDLPGIDPHEPSILVVDDDGLVREITSLMLRDMGYTVLEASSGPSALNELLSDRRVDLLVVDFAMPGMNGAEVAKRAHDIRPGLPVLFVTGYADSEALQSVGEDNIIQKPFQNDELAQKVTRALSRRDEAVAPPP